MKEEVEQTERICEWCCDGLEYAAFVLACLEGVMGGTGFVPPPIEDEWPLFCSRECLVAYLTGGRFGANRAEPRMP